MSHRPSSSVLFSFVPRHWTASFLLAASLSLAGCEDDAPAPAPAPTPVLSVPPLSPERADAPAYGVRGAFPVGYRVIDYPASGRGAPLVLKAWYPAAAASGEATRIDYPLSLKSPDWQALQPAVVHGRAIRDVPVSSARETYPLVVFSHGYALSPEWYSRLVEHLASWGFIVLAPEHQESDWFAAHEALIRRPADARDALDFLSTKGDLPQAIDPERIALVGHSFGGYTALAVGGARLDLAPLEARCGALTPEDPKQFLCAPFVGKAKEMAALAGLGEVPPGLWPAAADPRIKAILPIAGDAYVFGEAGLASVQIPVMAMGGTEDFGAPWDWGAGLAYEHAGSASKALVGLEGGSHMLAANPCSDFPWAGLLPPMEQGLFCLDPVWDRDRALDLIEHYATAFLLDTLTQSPEARAALLPSAPQPAGIRLQSPE